MVAAGVADRLSQFAGAPASDFVLHRPPMLLLDRVADPGREVTVCEWTVSEDSSFFLQGYGIPSYIGVEYMAQCVAVHAGLRARALGYGPPLGFLLGARHYKAHLRFFAAGVTYRATCRELIRDDNGMGSYECCILLLDNCVAEGRLAVVEKERGASLRG